VNQLDMRTVLVSYVLGNALCAAVVSSLWVVNRGRFAGLGFWLADFIMQFFAILVQALRGVMPVPISIVLSVPLIVAGTLLLYWGLECYCGKTSPRGYNYLLFAAFFAAHVYFTFVRPSLPGRNITFSLVLLAICAQCAWLMLRRVGSEERPGAALVGATFAAFCLVSGMRVVADVAAPPGQEFFASGPYDVLAVIAWQMLFISLTFSLFLMVNRTLVAALELDIAGRRQVESALKAQTDNLARSNEELEHFAYVASHDLQEPLRMVTRFTQLLAEQYSEKLDVAAGDYIRFAADGATRMQEMIRDLLEYSRVNNKNLEVRPTECQAVVRSIVHDLRPVIEESGAIVEADPLPVLKADPMRLGQLFQNLIGNAIKFRGQTAPRVRISAIDSGGDWLFSVQDNGIGIDPRQADRIFQIFQRLHTKTEYPGAGIGLAICRKVVERHGGRIWVESQPGVGSTFLFTLPKAGTDRGKDGNKE
jgi:signal transduction histidine kinase